MPRPISQLTGAALAATGVCLAIAALVAVFFLSPLSSSSAATRRPATGDRPTTPASVATVSSATTITARHTSRGTILLGPGGATLYAFSRDRRNHDACASVRACLSVWPELAVHGHLTAGRGVRRSLLGAITVHGAHQATYAGHPLYTFTDANGPADTSYVNTREFGGSWPAVSPTGRLVH